MDLSAESQATVYDKFINREITILLLLCSLYKESKLSGYSLIKKIQEESQNAIKLHAGTIYPYLESLEELKFVEKQFEEASPRKRLRYVYTLSETGKIACINLWAEWQGFENLLKKFLPVKEELQNE